MTRRVRYSARGQLVLVGAACIAVAGFTAFAAGSLLLDLASAVMRRQSTS